jgi:type I restriction enzyme M protein
LSSFAAADSRDLFCALSDIGRVGGVTDGRWLRNGAALAAESSIAPRLAVRCGRGYGVAMASNDGANAAALFEAANKLRGSVESAEYKHLVLGLIFLKYISDSFESRRHELEAELSDPESEGYLESESDRAEVLEDRDEYLGKTAFCSTPLYKAKSPHAGRRPWGNGP